MEHLNDYPNLVYYVRHTNRPTVLVLSEVLLPDLHLGPVEGTETSVSDTLEHRRDPW